MTRTRNSSFGGMVPHDADVDRPMFQTRFLELVQDVHFIIDKMTGLNGISSTAVCNHNGELGRGAPLRRTVIAQPLMAQDDRAGGLAAGGLPGLQMDEADVSTYGGGCYILAVPFFVAQGETLYRLEVEAHNRDDEMRAELYDSSLTLHSEQVMYADEKDRFVAILQIATPGDYYLCVWCPIGSTGGRLRSWQCFPPQKRTGSGAIPTGDGTSYFPVGIDDGGILAPETIHDEMIVNNYPVASWIVTTLNRSINWIIESATGWPVRGNGTLTLADSSATNPTTSEFWAHTQAGAAFTSEAEVEHVLFTEALGAVRDDTLTHGIAEVVDSGMTAGLLDWAPLIPTYGGTTRRTGHKRACYVPDFQTASSRLKARVLAVNSNSKGTPTAWDARVTTAAGSASAVAFSQLASTGFYVSDVLAVPFTPDAVNIFELELARSAGATQHGEIMIVGWQLVFDP